MVKFFKAQRITAKYDIDKNYVHSDKPCKNARLETRFFQDGQFLGSIRLPGVCRRMPGQKYLRDLFLDKHFIPFMIHRLSRMQTHSFRVNRDLHPISLSGADGSSLKAGRQIFFFDKDEILKKDPLNTLSARNLARITLDGLSEWTTFTETPNSQEIKNNGRENSTALVLWDFGRERCNPAEYTNAFDQVYLFRLGRRRPRRPQLDWQGNICRISARCFTLTDIARILHDNAGNSMVFFLIGRPVGPLARPDEKTFREMRRHGVRFGFPVLSRDRKKGIRDRLHDRFLHSRTIPPVSGFLSPADLIIRTTPIMTFSSLQSAVFFCQATDLMQFLPPYECRIASRRGLVRSMQVLFLQAAIEKAGFYQDISTHITVHRHRAARIVSGILLSAFRAIRAVKKDSRHGSSASWKMRIIKTCWQRCISSLTGSGFAGFGKEFIILLGSMAGFLCPCQQKAFRPRMTIPEGPIGEVGVDLINNRIIWEKGNGTERFVYITLFVGSRPCGCIGFPLYKNRLDPLLLAGRAKEEFLRWYGERFLRHMAQRLFDRSGSREWMESDRFKPQGVADVTSRPSLELILATRDRPDDLIKLLDSLMNLDLPVNLRVVDSCPSTDSTRMLCKAREIPYLLCPVPGKSRALNMGIQASSAEIVLFTDDDARVHPQWSKMLLDGFYSKDVMCVNGLVLPFQVKTLAQYLFETHMEEYKMGGLRRGFVEREFCPPFSPFRASHLGTGVNMAIRKDVFEKIGYFDPALSPGTPSRAGEEIDIYFRLIRAGHSVVYSPEAVVMHDHRESMDKLTRLMFNYGVSTGAFSMRWFLKEQSPLALFYLLRWNVLGLSYHALRSGKYYPIGLLLRESWGALTGPGFYLFSLLRQAFYNYKITK